MNFMNFSAEVGTPEFRKRDRMFLRSRVKEKAPGRSLTCTFMPDWQDILSIKLQRPSIFL